MKQIIKNILEIREESSGTFKVGEDGVATIEEVIETIGDETYTYVEVKFLDGMVRQYNLNKLTWFAYKE